MEINTYLAPDKDLFSQSISHRLFILCVIIAVFIDTGEICAQQTNSDTELAHLIINTNLPDSLYVVVDDDLIGAQKIYSTDTIKVMAGKHKLSLISNYYNDIDTTLEIGSDVQNVLNKNFSSFRIDYKTTFNELDAGHNTTIITDPRSVIYVDSEFVGVQKAQILLNPGTYNLLIEHPDHGSVDDTFEVAYQKETTLYRYHKNPKSTSVFMKLLPGGAYFSTGHNNKAYNTYRGLASIIIAYGVTELVKNDKKIASRSNLLYGPNYRRVMKNRADFLEKTQVVLGISAGLLYLITTFDGFQKPDNGYIIKPATLSFTDGYSNFTSAPGLSVSIEF